MNFKHTIFNFRKNLFSIVFITFILALLLFSNTNLSAARTGLSLWAKFVVPTLFPFFVATELLLHTNVIAIIGKFLNPIMKPIFKVPGISAFAFIMGSISGYPVGAKIVTSLRNNNLVSREQGERLLSFTNNSGPLFIIATVGIGLFGSSTIGILLLVIHLLSAISSAIVIGLCTKTSAYTSQPNSNFNISKSPINLSSLGEILSKAILDSINTLFLIGGFIVLFSVIISILISCGVFSTLEIVFTPLFSLFGINCEFIQSIFIGILEVTNGVNMIANIHVKNISTNLMLTAFILGFGGISVTLQILSVISKSDLSIKPYIIGKLIQATFSAFYVYITLCCFKGLNLDLTNNLKLSLLPILIFILAISFLIILFNYSRKELNKTNNYRYYKNSRILKELR